MAYSADIIRKMAQELYGIEMSGERAAEVAVQVTVLAESAHRAGHESDFNDELLSARQVLMRVAADGDSS